MIEKILAGLAIFSITSLIAYAFKARQLYAIVPKLHKISYLSDGGSVAELIIYNKGTKVEENIALEINQEHKCELLASNSPNSLIDNNVVNIDRLHSHSEISLILSVENGTLSHEDLISLSSKEQKGSFYKKTDDVPPAASNTAITISTIILVLSLFYWGGSIYDYFESKYINYKYSQIVENGWSNLGRYIGSDLSESYSNQEFPIRLVDVGVDKKVITINYEVINKSSLPFTVHIMDLNKFDTKKNDLPFKSVKVAPLEKTNLSIIYPNKNQEFIKLRCQIKFGDEYVHSLESLIKVRKYNKSM